MEVVITKVGGVSQGYMKSTLEVVMSEIEAQYTEGHNRDIPKQGVVISFE